MDPKEKTILPLIASWMILFDKDKTIISHYRSNSQSTVTCNLLHSEMLSRIRVFFLIIHSHTKLDGWPALLNNHFSKFFQMHINLIKLKGSPQILKTCIFQHNHKTRWNTWSNLITQTEEQIQHVYEYFYRSFKKLNSSTTWRGNKELSSELYIVLIKFVNLFIPHYPNHEPF